MEDGEAPGTDWFVDVQVVVVYETEDQARVGGMLASLISLLTDLQLQLPEELPTTPASVLVEAFFRSWLER